MEPMKLLQRYVHSIVMLQQRTCGAGSTREFNKSSTLHVMTPQLEDVLRAASIVNGGETVGSKGGL